MRRTTTFTGVHLNASGRTWTELATNVVDQLAVETFAQGTTITLCLAPRSRRCWLLHREQILVGTVRRRWDRTWDGFGRDHRLLISRAASRQDAVRTLLDYVGPGR